MKVFYSNSKKGFFIDGEQPPDSILLAPGEHARAMAWNSNGGVIAGVDEQGLMILASFDAPTLDQVKKKKMAQISDRCLIAIDSGFVHGGRRFDSDLISRTNIIGTAAGVQAGVPLPEGFTWRTSDNENVPMDGSGVIALGAALLQHVNQSYAASWQLKEQIEAATTPEEVEAINWPTAP